MIGPMVVGFDGSPGAAKALSWAFAEGRRRALPVHVVHVVQWPVNAVPGDARWLTEEVRLSARADVDKAIAATGGGADHVSIVDGSIVGTLCELSKHAGMVVLGARGMGGFGGLLIGSVGLSVAVHAASPVVVVRGEDRSDLPVLVGVDDSPQARLAARFAFEAADLRGCGVVALRAWRPEHGARDPEELETAELHALREALHEARTAHPAVTVTTRLVAGSAGRALVHASEEAQLVVAGSRGMGGFKGLLLGSVCQQLLHHAHCPVAVIR